MLYLIFSSESDFTDTAKYFVSVWPSLNDAIEAIDHLAEEPWGQYDSGGSRARWSETRTILQPVW